MDLEREIFKARLADRAIECGKLSIFKRRRTALALALWKNDVIHFDSVYLCQDGMSFTLNDTIRLRLPFKRLRKWLNMPQEITFEKGDTIQITKVNLDLLLEYYKSVRHNDL